MKCSDLQSGILSRISVQESEKKRILNGCKWLGLFSNQIVPKRGNMLDALCALMDEKMQYGKDERDMVMLQHRFEVELKDGSHVSQT